MIKLLLNDNTEIKFKQTMFPDGGNYVQLNDNDCPDNAISIIDYYKKINIEWIFGGDSEFIQLALLVDAIRRVNKDTKINLNIPYFPGARQDRVCEPGEAFNLKVYADLINNLGLNKVTVFDPHSDVTGALVNNIEIIDNLVLVKSSIVQEINKSCGSDVPISTFSGLITLISPDAGANKKIFKLAKQLPWKNIEVIRADKIRDTKTGKITGTEVFAKDVTRKTVFIVDDICSRGGTFMGLAQELYKLGADRIILIVSHYEGTADIDKLKESGIDKVYTYNHLGDYDPNEKVKFVEVIK